MQVYDGKYDTLPVEPCNSGRLSVINEQEREVAGR